MVDATISRRLAPGWALLCSQTKSVEIYSPKGPEQHYIDALGLFIMLIFDKGC